MTLKNRLNVAVVLCSISLSCFGDATEEVKSIMLSTSLSAKEKAIQVASIVEKTEADGVDSSGLTQVALQNASPEEVALVAAAILFKSPTDKNAATAIAIIMDEHPTLASQIVARLVNALDITSASKVMACVAIISPTPEVAQSIIAEVQSVVTDQNKKEAILVAVNNPVNVVDVQVVKATSIAVVPPPTTTLPPVVFPAISEELVSGYSRQTS